MANIETAKELITEWLHGEHSYQFKKFDDMYGTELTARRNFICNQEIPNKWLQSTIFRADRTAPALDRSNQLVLKTLAASRAVLVYDAVVAESQDRSNASCDTFEMLRECFKQTVEAELPSNMYLYEPEFDVVFESRQPQDVFSRAARLSLVALLETNHATGTMRLPIPGVPTGPTETWLAHASS